MTEGLAAPGIDRRRVLQGAAWAAPAIVVATAIPAAATSGGEPQLGALIFTQNYSKQITASIFDYGWASRPLLLVDPDIANSAAPGGPSVTGTTLTFTVPKAWLPGGTLAWHGVRTDQAGGGTPPDYVVTVVEGTSGYTFFLQTVTVLGPNYATTFSPEYRIELGSTVNTVGQQIVMRAAGNASGTAWGTNSTSTVVAG